MLRLFARVHACDVSSADGIRNALYCGIFYLASTLVCTKKLARCCGLVCSDQSLPERCDPGDARHQPQGVAVYLQQAVTKGCAAMQNIHYNQ